MTDSDIYKIEDFALVLNKNDNVAVAKRTIFKDSIFKIRGSVVRIGENIPAGHRFAIFDIRKGDDLLQYGLPFGVSFGIPKGALINERLVKERRLTEKQLKQYTNKRKYSCVGLSSAAKQRFFLGYIRKDGFVGTRNYYLIVPTSLCASESAIRIANSLNNKNILSRYGNIDGVVAASHTEGCGCSDGDVIDRLVLTLKNTIAHPNVGGALVVDLGCEKTNKEYVSKFFKGLASLGKPVDYLSIINSGGTIKSCEAGKKIILSRLRGVNNAVRKDVPISKLVIGTECGASDTFSGITANPLIGSTVDMIVNSGGSAILSEIPEMMGAEKLLIDRMISRKVATKFLNGMSYYKNLAQKLNVSMDGNFVPGNRNGGLINLTLKSLGAVLKGGSTRIVDFIEYGERMKRPGLVIMNGPGNDLESMTGLVASGANVILFSTGMGTPEGNLIVPVIKIPTKSDTYRRLKDDMDFNAGVLLDKRLSLAELGEKLLELTISVASGRKTRAEIHEKRSFQIWSAGKLTL